MELARIRNKALAEEREVAASTEEGQSGGTPDELLPQPASRPEMQEMATSKPDLPETAVVQFPELSPVRDAASPRRFDPLAVILAGRALAETAGMGEQQQKSAALAGETEQGFEEFLCFNLGNEEYGINLMEIKEIIKPRELTEVPRTPDFVDGVLSLRGVIVPVLDMRRRLAMPPAQDRVLERIVIVRHDECLTGLRVDRINGVLRILDDNREQAPGVLEGAAREFVSGIGRCSGRMIIILDVGSIIDFSFGEVNEYSFRSN